MLQKWSNFNSDSSESSILALRNWPNGVRSVMSRLAAMGQTGPENIASLGSEWSSSVCLMVPAGGSSSSSLGASSDRSSWGKCRKRSAGLMFALGMGEFSAMVSECDSEKNGPWEIWMTVYKSLSMRALSQDKQCRSMTKAKRSGGHWLGGGRRKDIAQPWPHGPYVTLIPNRDEFPCSFQQGCRQSLIYYFFKPIVSSVHISSEYSPSESTTTSTSYILSG